MKRKNEEQPKHVGAPDEIRRSFYITEAQDKFLDRKLEECRQRDGFEHDITRSHILQGLINEWMERE